MPDLPVGTEAPGTTSGGDSEDVCGICPAPADETVVVHPAGAHQKVLWRIPACTDHTNTVTATARALEHDVIGITDYELASPRR